MLFWRTPSEREQWGTKLALTPDRPRIGLPQLDAQSARLYAQALPRGVPIARPWPERPPINRWMSPDEVMAYRYMPGQLILGRLGDVALGHMDDRPMVTVAGARAGKSSTILAPNLYCYPGSVLVLDPKGELAAETAELRTAMGHKVVVLDPFGQSGLPSAHFNVLAEIDPDSDHVIDDVASITNALVVDEGGSNSRHWTDSAKALLKGLILFTLTLPEAERHLVTVRQFLTLTHPAIQDAVIVKNPLRTRKHHAGLHDELLNREQFIENRAAVEVLLRTMAAAGSRFDGILASIGRRFFNTPANERGSVFSTAAAQTDFLDSMPLRQISQRSDFELADLRSDRPTTIYLCLPASHMETHFRWLRLFVQQACVTLEKFGSYPRYRSRILFMMEEFATLGHMEIMERAAAYFPGFGVKLWVVLQDTTQLRRHYKESWETFLGNAGVLQFFATNDMTTQSYICERLAKLIHPFEIEEAFRREDFGQLIKISGYPPMAAVRLSHDDVMSIRRSVARRIMPRRALIGA
jgi:type IV secretion system protein VirD4